MKDLEEILLVTPISSSQVRRWLRSSVTRVFFECVKVEMEMCDVEAHDYLSQNEPTQALSANGGRRTCLRIGELPGDVIDHLIEQEKNSNEKEGT